uniref:Uncharacterized protein n=1 Tax=Trichogramma kaykai TaxID=54128 RepID=A0ABD2XCR7_9HYME
MFTIGRQLLYSVLHLVVGRGSSSSLTFLHSNSTVKKTEYIKIIELTDDLKNENVSKLAAPTGSKLPSSHASVLASSGSFFTLPNNRIV